MATTIKNEQKLFSVTTTTWNITVTYEARLKLNYYENNYFIFYGVAIVINNYLF